MSYRHGRTELEPPQPDAARGGICTESDIIRTLSAAVHSRRAMWVGNGDDAAVLPDGTVVSTDLLCEGVHFDERLEPGDVAWKAVAASVSDLASMGARTNRILLTLAHPGPERAWLDAFAEGLADACTRFEVDLIGGDTTRAASCCVGITALGRLSGGPMTRSGARPGDRLYVAGVLGLAGAGYRWDEPPAEALHALRRPDPPVTFALALAAGGLASAAMDASDGAANDLPRLAEASGVCVVLDPASIPVPALLAGAHDRRDLLLGAGDDYALWFTSSAPAEALESLAVSHGVQLSAVGHVRQGAGAMCTDGPWPRRSWQHFGEEA